MPVERPAGPPVAARDDRVARAVGALSREDLERVLHVAATVAESGWQPEDPSLLLQLLTELVPCDFVTVTVADVAGHSSRVDCSPVGVMTADLVAAFDEHVEQHPYVRYHAATGRRGAHPISELEPGRRWRQTGLYAEHFRPLRAEHQLCDLLGTRDGALVGLGLSRSTVPFSDRDAAVLDALRPHLAGAVQHAHALAVLRGRLAVHEAPVRDRAQQVLERLTRREREVAVLLALGLADKQIATRLGISTRTVENHVGQVLRKLQAPNRAAAAVLLAPAVPVPPPPHPPGA